ncbi:uncharacterized protein PHALS_10415 [Plasmopara halstedii]|uniref:Uncharacterized protein n=1 Tax=Plasmopara halstedii TaxID=4781 RepID=A0A0N7L514_PLAHL|nr:uncharacterized protein PHALS_10415 [Plasmopara halstedii]CEG40203.1 hypothetical protein PHALS_10415 [Plasmopara halstedii]|eukprot:XP_024576572.1 hypothetical protein PHALS_10415 [Plasmopara halstedii]
MQQFIIKKKSNRNSSQQSSQKRMRLSPTLTTFASRSILSVLPRPRPQKKIEASLSVLESPSCQPTSATAKKNTQKLEELRRSYLGDIVMVIQELKVILTYCPESACSNAPVPPLVILKLVRTIETLEKLQTLLLMNPARVQRVSLAQLEIVEHQITVHLLPLATLLRSFEGEGNFDCELPEDKVTCKMEPSWDHQYDTESPRSLSGTSVAPMFRQDWRFLSIALSLQL